ncbi:MAG: C40 family peptidase [Armatimonadota bacterium]|nr:MAG: C40 family peptidase [Armatimonadota bacterium]
MTRVALARDLGLHLLGHPYLYGGKPVVLDRLPTPDEPLDCSGFVYLLLAARVRIGEDVLGAGLQFIEKGNGSAAIHILLGSWNQEQWSRRISVADALENVGCLLFRHTRGGHPRHVGFSLGAGHTLEAVGGRVGMVTIFRPAENARDRWDAGGKYDALYQP